MMVKTNWRKKLRWRQERSTKEVLQLTVTDWEETRLKKKKKKQRRSEAIAKLQPTT
jgi:hypothetical protein